MRSFFSRSFLSFGSLSLGLGACLTLAFAPFHWFLLGIILPAILLGIWWRLTPKQAFFSGWLFGIGFFSTGVYWIYISVHTFGKAPPLLAFLITSALIGALGLFFALQGWLTRRCFPGRHLIWGFPVIWVFIEIVRTYLLTGFPWLLLGYSQMDSVLSHVAPLFSVYGVSFVTLVMSSLLASLVVVEDRRMLWAVPPIILLMGLLLWSMGKFTWGVRPIGKPLTVSLIQGNVHQSLKWERSHRQKIIETYYHLTTLHWGSDLIIWPEAAIPMLAEDAALFLDKLNQEAKEKKTAVILGIPILQGTHFYNGLLALGEGEGTYLKQHLVPFGEYMPLRSWLSFILDQLEIPMSDMSAGSANQELLKLKNRLLSASICYEIAYPALIARQLPAAHLLITLTDDSWFDPSIAQDQQLQMAQMRALETGRFLLSATNDGLTAIINPKGKIVKELPPSTEGVLTGVVSAMQGSTPWVRFLNLINTYSNQYDDNY